VTASHCLLLGVISGERSARGWYLEVLANAGVMALASMFVGVLPLMMGVAYALWPNEQRLMLMRPLSLAAVFAAIAGVAVGFINELRFIGRSETVTFSQQVAVGTAESLVPLFFGFGCLTVAWLCVTLGLWRRP
jgi:hypothetical protein